MLLFISFVLNFLYACLEPGPTLFATLCHYKDIICTAAIEWITKHFVCKNTFLNFFRRSNVQIWTTSSAIFHNVIQAHTFNNQKGQQNMLLHIHFYKLHIPHVLPMVVLHIAYLSWQKLAKLRWGQIIDKYQIL